MYNSWRRMAKGAMCVAQQHDSPAGCHGIEKYASECYKSMYSYEPSWLRVLRLRQPEMKSCMSVT